MSEQREMTLDEWCNELPEFHLANAKVSGGGTPSAGMIGYAALAATEISMGTNEAKHGDYAGVVDVARNGVDEVIRLTRQSNDLALLVCRLVRRLRAARLGTGSEAGDDQLSRDALDYLRRKGLSGDPLRTSHNTGIQRPGTGPLE